MSLVYPMNHVEGWSSPLKSLVSELFDLSYTDLSLSAFQILVTHVLMDTTNMMLSADHCLVGWLGRICFPAQMHWATWLAQVYLRALPRKSGEIEATQALTTTPWWGNVTLKTTPETNLRGSCDCCILGIVANGVLATASWPYLAGAGVLGRDREMTLLSMSVSYSWSLGISAWILLVETHTC